MSCFSPELLKRRERVKNCPKHGDAATEKKEREGISKIMKELDEREERWSGVRFIAQASSSRKKKSPLHPRLNLHQPPTRARADGGL
jgi:hypothetical protein